MSSTSSSFSTCSTGCSCDDITPNQPTD